MSVSLCKLVAMKVELFFSFNVLFWVTNVKLLDIFPGCFRLMDMFFFWDPSLVGGMIVIGLEVCCTLSYSTLCVVIFVVLIDTYTLFSNRQSYFC